MQLTISSREKMDHSISLSRYLVQDSRISLLQNHIMDTSDTQLLQSSPIINENSSFCISSEESTQKPFVLKTYTDNTSFSELGPEFLIDQKKAFNFPVSGLQLENIFQDLVVAINTLCKRLEGADTKLKQLRTSSAASTQTVAKQCWYPGGWKNILLELIEVKGQLKLYQSQMEQSNQQLLKINLDNEYYKAELRKSKTQNFRMKELLKQYRNYFKNKKAKASSKDISSQNNHLQNSLDKRLNDQQMFNYEQIAKLKLNPLIFSKDTPKTPHLLRYQSCQNISSSQKTQPRTKNKPHQLQKIIEFQERIERSRYQKRLKGPQDNNLWTSHYPFAKLLEEDLQTVQQKQSILTLDHFSTMESLPQDPFNSALLNDF